MTYIIIIIVAVIIFVLHHRKHEKLILNIKMLYKKGKINDEAFHLLLGFNPPQGLQSARKKLLAASSECDANNRNFETQQGKRLSNDATTQTILGIHKITAKDLRIQIIHLPPSPCEKSGEKCIELKSAFVPISITPISLKQHSEEPRQTSVITLKFAQTSVITNTVHSVTIPPAKTRNLSQCIRLLPHMPLPANTVITECPELDKSTKFEQTIEQLDLIVPETPETMGIPTAVPLAEQVNSTTASLEIPKAPIEEPPAKATDAKPKNAKESVPVEPEISRENIPIPVILTIGVVLLSIAGCAFISSTWNTSSEGVKLLSIFGFSIVFYAAFALAHFILHIPSSARAFYILGTTALSITAIAMEILGIVLPDASIQAMSVIPLAIFAAGMFVGYKVFKTPLFPALGGIVSYIILCILSMLAFSSNAMLYVFPTIASSAAAIICHLVKKDTKPEFKKVSIIGLAASLVIMLLASFGVENNLEIFITITISALMTVASGVVSFQKKNTIYDIVHLVLITWTLGLFCAHVPAFSAATLPIYFVLMTTAFAGAEICSKKLNRNLNSNSHIIQLVSYIIVAIVYIFNQNVHLGPWLMLSIFIPTAWFYAIGFLKKTKVQAFMYASAGLGISVMTICAMTNLSKDSTLVPNLITIIPVALFCIASRTYAVYKTSPIHQIFHTALIACAVCLFNQYFLSQSDFNHFIGYLTLTASHAGTLLCCRKNKQQIHIATYLAQIVVFGLIAFMPAKLETMSLLIPASYLLLTGAHLNIPIRTVGLISGTLFIIVTYFILKDFQNPVTHVLFATSLCAYALMPENAFKKYPVLSLGNAEPRIISASVVVLVLLLLANINCTSDFPCEFTNHYIVNSLCILVPFSAMIYIERRKALKTEHTSALLWTTIAAPLTSILTATPILLLIFYFISRTQLTAEQIAAFCNTDSENLDFAENTTIAVSNTFDIMRRFIAPINLMLLAGYILYPHKKPALPKYRVHVAVSGAVLLLISYSTITDYLSEYEGSVFVTTAYIVTACFITAAITSAFIPRRSTPQSALIKAESAAGFITAMAIIQHIYDVKLGMFMLLPAIAMSIISTIKSAQSTRPMHQTATGAAIAALSYWFITEFIINISEFFKISLETDDILCRSIPVMLTGLSTIPLVCEHCLCRRSENRPYLPIVLLSTSLPALVSMLLFIYQKMPLVYVNNSILAVSALLCIWSINYREHKHYDIIMAATLLFSVHNLMTAVISNSDIPAYFNSIFTAVILGIAALIFGRQQKGYTNLRLVWILEAIPLLLAKDTLHIAHGAGILILSLNLLQYMTERGKCDKDRILITCSAGIFAIACSIKLSMLDDLPNIVETIKPELIMLIPVATSYILSSTVWKGRKPSHEISFALAVLSLLAIYLSQENAFVHAISVTVIAIAMIAASMRLKLYRYLAAGATTIVVIFFSQTSSFWTSLNWWTYAAIVGLIVISIATTNEILRRKGSSIMKSLAKARPDDWKW